MNYPLLGVVAELQRYLQQYATEVLSAAGQERRQGIFTGLETTTPVFEKIEAEKGHYAMWASDVEEIIRGLRGPFFAAFTPYKADDRRIHVHALVVVRHP